jgi:hypothetical protein
MDWLTVVVAEPGLIEALSEGEASEGSETRGAADPVPGPGPRFRRTAAENRS